MGWMPRPCRHSADNEWIKRYVFDRHLYRQRHRDQNTFPLLKQWHGIAERYAKRLSS